MNCDRIAGVYRWLEYVVFGRALERCRTYYLDIISGEKFSGCRHALLLGDGDGRFLESYLRANPTVIVETVDSSERMIELARSRVASVDGGLRRVRFIRSDAREAPLTPSYDLIVTHFFLDCLRESEIDALASRIQAVVSTNTHWLISEFRIPPKGLMRPFATALISLMYVCFRLATGLSVRRLPNHHRVLERHGFRLIAEHLSLRGMLVSQLWDIAVKPGNRQ